MLHCLSRCKFNLKHCLDFVIGLIFFCLLNSWFVFFRWVFISSPYKYCTFIQRSMISCVRLSIAYRFECDQNRKSRQFFSPVNYKSYCVSNCVMKLVRHLSASCRKVFFFLPNRSISSFSFRLIGPFFAVVQLINFFSVLIGQCALLCVDFMAFLYIFLCSYISQRRNRLK